MKLIILIILTIFLSNTINTQIFDYEPVCRKYVCSQDLARNTCIKFNPGDQVISLQKCKNEGEFCPFRNNIENSLVCESEKVFRNQKSFPGEKCEDNSDCVYGKCQDSVCRGKLLGDTCKGHNQCKYGSSCRLWKDGLRYCLIQSREWETCANGG